MKKIISIYIFLFCCMVAFAQENGKINVGGTVFDENGLAMPGVSVSLKDRPGLGAVTDAKGAFKLTASKGDVVVISFIGYQKMERSVQKEELKLTFKMIPDSHQLDEAVVTAMGAQQRKISIVGAVTNVDVVQLQVPATSLTNMLGGRVAGVINLQTSGEPGKNISEFWIRGIGTFGANSSALVLIDGLEGSLSNIDPADIESFSVLKDASATAVYGVRGANGVVLVTTKHGKLDKLSIRARVNMTVSTLTKMPEYLGAYEYAKLANEARVVRGDLPLYSNMELDLIKYKLDPDLYPDVNWRKEMINPTSFQHTYYVSAQGGGSVARYFVSLGTSQESAAYVRDKASKYSNEVSYNTYNYRANIDMNITKTTGIYFGVDGYLSKKNEPGNGNTDYLWSAQSQLTPLTIPTRYSTGQLPAYGKTDQYSPYVMLNYTGMSSAQNFNGNITLALNQDLSPLIKGLKYRMQGAYSNSNNFSEVRSVMPDMYAASGRNVNGDLMLVKRVDKAPAKYSSSNKLSWKYFFENTLSYETKINKDHRISGLVYYYMSESQGTDAKESLNAIPQRYQGLSSRISYGFKDAYFLDVNFGYTGSENFEPGKQFGFFPSIAGGWIPTSYEFVNRALPWLSFLKIRASYGLVGNDRISRTRFPYLTIVNSGNAGWGGVDGIAESSIGANNLQWEKAKKADIGIEGKLFNHSVDFTVDFFNDQRDGIFQPRTQVPDYVGLVNMPYGNVGRMRSYGSDGNISYHHDINKKMSFTLRANFTYSKNTVQNWEQAYPKYPYQQIQGSPYNVDRGYIALGLFRDAQDVANSPVQFGKYLPGDIKYKDVNGDGKINTDDKVPLSYTNYPRFMGGFGGEFRYGKISLGLLFKAVGNTDYYHTGTGNGDGMGYVPFYNGVLGNVLPMANVQENRWTPASYSGTKDTENPNAIFPRLSYGYNENNAQMSTFWKDNCHYVRLQDVSFSYNLALSSLKQIGISSIDLQLSGSNLLVWSNVKLGDPEQAAQNGRAYPIPARYTFQMYVNF